MTLAHRPGSVLHDTAGQPIGAHGGALMRHDGRWYWYGEAKRPPGVDTSAGVVGYTSTDLMTWTPLGTVLRPEAMRPLMPAGIQRAVIERPKVLFHPGTRRFVMWMHLDGDGYRNAHAGVAVADRPEGPFTPVRCFRPLTSPGADAPSTFNDLNVLIDADGSAYLFYSGDGLMTLHIARLGGDWTDVERPAVEGRTWARALPGMVREGPAPFAYRGRYYLLTSGCVCWTPNPLAWASAPHPFGPWELHGDPCTGTWADTGYATQPTCVIPAPGAPDGTFLYLGDRWIEADLADSRHIWLPFRIGSDGLRLDWRSAWDASTLAASAPPSAAPHLRARTVCGGISPVHPDRVRLEWDAVPGADLYVVRRGDLVLERSDRLGVDLDPGLPGVPGTYTVSAANLAGEGPRSQPTTLTVGRPRPLQLSDHPAAQRWTGWAFPLADHAWDGSALAIGSRTFAKGLFTHAEARLLWDLGGCYGSFRAEVGLLPTAGSGTASFAVHLDGREVWRSPLRRASDEALTVQVPCAGAHRLELRVDAGPAGIGYAQALWGDLRLDP